VRSLLSNGQVEMATAAPPLGTTYKVEIDAEGHRRLRRKRFAAW